MNPQRSRTADGTYERLSGNLAVMLDSTPDWVYPALGLRAPGTASLYAINYVSVERGVYETLHGVLSDQIREHVRSTLMQWHAGVVTS
jgi:hypothetical protein